MGLSPNWIQKVPNRGLPIRGNSLSAPSPLNFLKDGDAEKALATDWTAGSGANLTKDTTSPIQGGRCLKIAYTAIADPYAVQPATLTIGHKYRLLGYGAGDGAAIPRIGNVTAPFNLTSSTTWQRIDYTWTAASTASPYFYALTAIPGYCRYDCLWIIRVT